MRPRKSSLRPCLALAATLSLFGGCELSNGLNNHKPENPSVPATPVPDAASISSVLEMMTALLQSDPGGQAEVFQAAKDAADLTPTTSNRLRFAMALATPGHTGFDPVAAQRQLAELLARPETMLPLERNLALVQLKEVEQRLILQAENQRLRDDTARESRDRQQAISHRLQVEVDENAHLRKALDEAQAKLDAVTHIERSINDRNDGDTRKK